MPDILFEYPHVIAVADLQPNGAYNLQNSPELVAGILKSNYKGVVTKDGAWGVDSVGNTLCPGGDWTIDKPKIGVYTITHSLGYMNTSLNVTLFQSPGSFTIVEHSPTSFTVKTTLNNRATDMPFAFTLAKLITSS